MMQYTPYQARYFAEQIDLKRSQSSMEGLASTMSGVKVDLNPHQVEAALFALRSPLSSGALLADEVGLGKTIEAGIVMAQYWSERKRSILLITPASLRMQWRSELSEKFFMNSVIMDSKLFNRAKKDGKVNPFNVQDQVVICSFDFASRRHSEIHSIPWDLVVIDEAHRLRNVYKSNNVTGKRLKQALAGRKKLLLTATPLQNNLMELYGLVSIIDEHVFGDPNTFREMYVNVSNAEMRNYTLRQRLQPLCIRTLRKQVTEYVPYTKRIPITQEYNPSKDEQKLYDYITNYLQEDKLYALPAGQRNLITMVLRKLLASSSFAIAGTLKTMIERLEGLKNNIERQLDMDDFDTFDELSEGDEENIVDDELQNDIDGIDNELQQLNTFLELARRITSNSKGENLLEALQRGFCETEKRGGQRKAVIFTESRRTQVYLLRLLEENGYKGKIVFLNGVNSDEISKGIYERWIERHKNDGTISGSKQADMKAAVVEEFKNNAEILIGTEAAAEGINLQFCSIVVNYDLPWNPQRIEQRIGRCHRYGQKNDVVVINFLNTKNAADVRVFDLLEKKFCLFSGVFGSSDEVLGSIESGVDFEKRIAAIYQQCKTTEEIQQQFDALQAEMADQINEKMLAARRSILENFDEDVAKKLAQCKGDAVATLDRFSQWMYYFFLIHGAERVEPLEEMRFACRFNGDVHYYNLSWKKAEEEGDQFLRREDSFFRSWLNESKTAPLANVHIRFNASGSARHFSFLQKHIGMRGTLAVDKLRFTGVDKEEQLILTVITEDGTVLDDANIDRMMMLHGEIVGDALPATQELFDQRNKLIEAGRTAIENANREYYLAECAKLDAYSDDLKEGLQQELKALKNLIREKKKAFNESSHLPLMEIVALKDEINGLEKKRKLMQREIYEKEDEIDTANERLQAEVRARLDGKFEEEHVMTISFEIA